MKKLVFMFLSAALVMGCGSGGGGNNSSNNKPPNNTPTEVEAKWDETNWDQSDWA